MNLVDGINNVSNGEYHSDRKYFSSSAWKLLLKDAEAFHKQYILGEKQDKKIDAFVEGSYAHSLILEPHLINEEYAFFDGMRKQGAVWEEFKASNPSKQILSKPQKVKIDRLFKAYEKRRKSIDLISGGFAEHTICGKIMDIPCKVRADYINVDKGYIVDVKTTAFDTDKESFKMTVGQFEYGLSAAMYKHMFDEFYGKSFDFYFLVLGKKDESCEIFKASEQTIGIGMTNLRKSLQKYQKCCKTGIWKEQLDSLSKIDGGEYEIFEV